MTRQILQSYHYNVLEAADGEEALHVAAGCPGPIHLMVTDVVMPRLSGRSSPSRLAPRRPAMKVLYMSGYTDDAIVRHGVIESSTPFLQKPFTPATLAMKVREVLNASQAGEPDHATQTAGCAGTPCSAGLVGNS